MAMMENNNELKDHKSEKKSRSGLVSALIIILLILLVVTAIFYFRGKTSGTGGGEGFFAELFGQKVNIDGSTSSSDAGKGGKNDKTEEPAMTALKDNSSKSTDDAADKAKTEPVNADPSDDTSDPADNNGSNTDDPADQTSNGDHQHVFDNWVTVKAATCGDPGEEQATCSCGATTTRAIPPTGDHVWGDWEVVENYQDLGPAIGGIDDDGNEEGDDEPKITTGIQVLEQQGGIRRRTCRQCNQVQEEVNN